jgi:hypothetical protein
LYIDRAVVDFRFVQPRHQEQFIAR